MKHHGWHAMTTSSAETVLSTAAGVILFLAAAPLRKTTVLFLMFPVPEIAHYVDGTSSVIAKPWWRADSLY